MTTEQQIHEAAKLAEKILYISDLACYSLTTIKSFEALIAASTLIKEIGTQTKEE